MSLRSVVARRARGFLDLLVTTAIGIAAVGLIWRTWAGPVGPEPPRPPAFEDIASLGLNTSVSDAPAIGSSRAPVVIIEYSDFECPFCARYASEIFGEIEREFVDEGRIEYVFRNYPIDQIHPSAIRAAQAAGCAHQQGRFLEMRALLFKNYRALASMDWIQAASDTGLEERAFDACLRSADVAAIHAERSEAERLGVSSTPTFFIGTRSENGRVRLVARSRGAPPYPVFKGSLEQTISGAEKSTLAWRD